MGLPVVGLVEVVTVTGQKSVTVPALLDTGARTSSVDLEVAAKAQLGPVTRVAVIRQASHKHCQRRVVVKAKLRVDGKEFETEVTLQDRSHMRFPVLVGRNVLAGNFVVDAQRKGAP